MYPTNSSFKKQWTSEFWKVVKNHDCNAGSVTFDLHIDFNPDCDPASGKMCQKYLDQIDELSQQLIKDLLNQGKDQLAQ